MATSRRTGPFGTDSCCWRISLARHGLIGRVDRSSNFDFKDIDIDHTRGDHYLVDFRLHNDDIDSNAFVDNHDGTKRADHHHTTFE